MNFYKYPIANLEYSICIPPNGLISIALKKSYERQFKKKKWNDIKNILTFNFKLIFHYFFFKASPMLKRHRMMEKDSPFAHMVDKHGHQAESRDVQP